MKVETTRDTVEVFKPVKIAITCTSFEEVSKLFAIFNHGGITKTVEFSDEADDINESIQDVLGWAPDYDRYHESLERYIRGGGTEI